METLEKIFIILAAIFFVFVLMHCFWTFETDDDPLKYVKKEIVNLHEKGKL
jgi:hypothetical protein